MPESDVITPAPEQEAPAQEITLEEYRAQREGKVKPQPEAKPAETSEEPAKASETEADSDPADKQEEPDGKPKKLGGFQKRIDKLTREREELRAENERLKALAGDKPAEKPEAAKVETTGKPQVENFDTYDAYVEALADWKVEQKEQQRQQAEAERRAKEETAKRQSTFAERAAAAREKHEDFDDVLESAPPITAPMQEVLLESELGPELAYWLGTHPADLKRITALSPVAQVRELAKIELSLSTPPETKKPKASAAPEPIRPVGTAASPSHKRPEDMDLSEYRAWRAAGGGR